MKRRPTSEPTAIRGALVGHSPKPASQVMAWFDSLATPEWAGHASCNLGHHGISDETWFPERKPGQIRHIERAQRICAQCPVIKACAQHALRLFDDRLVGIWAGINVWESTTDAGKQKREHCRDQLKQVAAGEVTP